MVQHHPASGVDAIGGDLTNVPWALTTHLLSVNLPQFHRATTAPFLTKAARGQLSKPFIGQWLANDRLYIKGYIALASRMLALLKSSTPTRTVATGDAESLESRFIRWLEAALTNIEREDAWFVDMTQLHGLHATGLGADGMLQEPHKSRGLQLFESLYARYTTTSPAAGTHMPWLEGMTILWATEKVYYEAWSWARRQDESSSRDLSADLDGGAMRNEFIPNWSNKNFMMFVETLERNLNEAVSVGVGRDDAAWEEVKMRAEKVWRETLDAEEAFWPDVEGLVGDVAGTNAARIGAASDERLARPSGDGLKELGSGYVPHVGCA